MNEPSLADRVTLLEELFTHQQHLVQQLNDVAIGLRADLDALTTKIETQQGQIRWLNENNSSVDDREEKPPHY